MNDIEKTNLLNEILKFNEVSNSFEYGIARNGKVPPSKTVNTTVDDWINLYHLASPKQFVRQGGGVCWDWVSYEMDYFKTHFPTVRTDSFYIVFDDKAECPTHTFMTFIIDREIYYFESSFYEYRGVYRAKSAYDISDFVSYNMDQYDKSKSLLSFPRYITKYNALDPKIYGMGCEEFMDYCIHQRRVNRKYNPYFIAPIKLKSETY